MDDVFALVDQARLRSAALNDHLAKVHGIDSGYPPIAGLNMANQNAVLSLELLHYYRQVWNRANVDVLTDLERSRKENSDRVIILTKSAFILSLSAFEFCAKVAIAQRPARLRLIKKRVYFSDIVNESVLAGVISDTDGQAWKGIIELRNMLVHHNGIAERTASHIIPGTQGIRYVTGQMTAGNLKLFPEIHLWSIEAFARWCDGFLR